MDRLHYAEALQSWRDGFMARARKRCGSRTNAVRSFICRTKMTFREQIAGE